MFLYYTLFTFKITEDVNNYFRPRSLIYINNMINS